MKKRTITILFTLVLVNFIIVGCGGGKTPAETTGSFIIAVKDGDYDLARSYIIGDVKNNFSDFTLDRYREDFEFALAAPSDIIIDGNQATEPIYGTDKTFIVRLIKKLGKWKISGVY